MIELARVKRGQNNMEIARAFAKCEAFKGYTISAILETMRSYEKAGLLILTAAEAIIFHDCDN